MGRMIIGAVVAAIAMFVIGGLFYASGLENIAFRNLDDRQAAAVQQTLAANLGAGTGTYLIPDTHSAEQTAMYGKGPIATVHYNHRGFPAVAGGALLGGLVLDFVVALLLGLGLLGIAGGWRATIPAQRLAICFAVGTAAYAQLKEPIFFHHDWWTFIYQFIVDAITLAVGGLILARWFLPRGEIREVSMSEAKPGTTSEL